MLKKIKAHITLSKEILERIDKLVGKRREK